MFRTDNIALEYFRFQVRDFQYFFGLLGQGNAAGYTAGMGCGITGSLLQGIL